jgi:Uma2 family endonuclease
MIQKRSYEPEDLLTLPDGDQYELVDGELVERPMSKWSNYVAGRIYNKVFTFAEEHKSGWTFPEGAQYQCFPHAPKMVRKADTSFVKLDRMTAAEAREPGYIMIVPDLAVEVISPNDIVYELDEKLLDYQRAGFPLVWVVNPETRTVKVHRGDGSIQQLNERDEVSGEDILPGFRCLVSDFFRTP